MERLGHWMAMGAILLSFGGCGSLHLYSKEADVAATSAKSDYDASKITEALKAEGAMLDGLETKDAEAFRKVTKSERNLELLALVNESGTSKPRKVGNGLVPRFHGLVDDRLVVLSGGGDPLAILKQLDKAKRDLRDAVLAENIVRTQLGLFDARFASLPVCNQEVASLKNDLGAADAAAALTKDNSFHPKSIPASAVWGTAIGNLGTACGKVLAARAAVTNEQKKANDGQLGRSVIAADAQERLLGDSEANARAAGAAMRKAAEELAAAHSAVKSGSEGVDLTCKTPKPPDAGASAPAANESSAKADPVEKGTALCDALARLNALGDFGIKVLSEERLDRINTVLGALSGLEPAEGEQPLEPSLALLSATSRFAQALKQYQTAGTLPALEPLLIEKQLAAAQLAYALAGVELSKARVRHAQEFRDATLLEMDLLTRAKAELGSLGPAPAADASCTVANTVFCASMSQLLTDKAFSGATADGMDSPRRSAYRAMALLSESYSVARDRQQTAEVRLIDTDYRDSLLRSEASVAAWNAMLSVPIDQLKIYHAGGLTPQEIAQLLQAVGVVGIAARIK